MTPKSALKRPNRRSKSDQNDSEDDDRDLTRVYNADDLLRDQKYDFHSRLYRFLRHIGHHGLSELADTTGAYFFWGAAFMAWFTIPYIVITTFLKFYFPFYLINYRGYYCSVPLESYLTFRLIFDTLWYLTFLIPGKFALHNWRFLVVVDLAVLAVSTPLILSSNTQNALCPSPLITLPTILIYSQLLCYVLAFISIIHRVIFVTKDPYHPAFWPTIDATGDYTDQDDKSSLDMIKKYTDKTMGIIRGDIIVDREKQYERLNDNKVKFQDDISDISDIDDDDISFNSRSTNNFDDSDLSDLDSGIDF